MRIATAICEYNPMHNGHIEHIKKLENLNADYIVIVMSGNISQRGELTVNNKYERARQAILAGADAVIELPTIFATQTAEIFAKGGVKLINSLPGEKTIIFGCEDSNKDDLDFLTNILINENENLKNEIKSQLDNGLSYIKSRELAIDNLYGKKYANILSKPNNILAIEYIKAIKQNSYKIDYEPITRNGDNYLENKILSLTPSAQAIRNCIINNDFDSCKNCMPSFSFESLPKTIKSLDDELFISLLNSNIENLSKTNDCSEGLENKILKEITNNNSLNDLINSVCNKRYTYSRIKRIILSNMLGIYKENIFNALNSDLYLKVLAVNKNSDILKVLSSSSYPLITRKKDISALNEISKYSYDIDDKVNTLYNYKCKETNDQFKMLMV